MKERVYTDVSSTPHKQYALLLGTAKADDNNVEFPFYRSRINATVQLYRSGKISYILVSSNNDSLKNAEKMMADLIASGIPADKIIVDRYGLRTLDSIIRCKDVFGLNDVMIISQRGHCERALCIAGYKGLKAIGFTASGGYGLSDIGGWYHEQVARFMMITDLLFNRKAAVK